jgi:hypothetical protein
VDAPRGDSQACPRPSPFADPWSVNRADIDRHRDLIADARTRLDELVTAMSTLMVHGRQEDLERLQNARPWWLRNGPEIVRLIKEAEPAKTYMRDRTWYLTNLYSHPTLSEVLSLLENVAPNTNIEESADKARDLFTEYEGYLDRQEQLLPTKREEVASRSRSAGLSLVHSLEWMQKNPIPGVTILILAFAVMFAFVPGSAKAIDEAVKHLPWLAPK